MTLAAETVPVQVKGVTKRFRQGDASVEALKNLSLTVGRGDFVAVMGASGSGKSTLLHVIAGLTPPDQGEVRVDGENLTDMPDRRLTLFRRQRVGLVFQAFNLIPALTAEDNILLPLLAGGESRSQTEPLLDTLLRRLNLADRRKHKPDALSGGEQQRVAVARALITNPALILADEPTGSLDSVSGQKLCRLLRELCEEQKRTIMLVTHEPAVAVWAKRIVVLKDGRILTEFATADFRDAHALAAHYQDVVGVPAGAEARP